MTCKRTTALLGRYLDGELPDAARRDVEEHLGACDECCRQVEDLRRLSQVLRQSEVPLSQEQSQEMARGFQAKLQARVTAEQRRSWWPPRLVAERPGWAMAVATACLLVAVAGGALRFQERARQVDSGVAGGGAAGTVVVSAENRAEVAAASTRLATLDVNQAMNVLATESDVQLVSTAPPPTDVQLAFRDLLMEAGAFEHEERSGST